MGVLDSSAREGLALPVCLVIMDGFGLAPEGPGKAISLARTPFLDKLFGAARQQPSGDETAPEKPRRTGVKEAQKSKKKYKFLDSYCVSLNDKARASQLDRIVGRAEEIERVIQILNRRQKNTPCLIGEPGVGNPANAEGLAMKIVAGDVA